MVIKARSVHFGLRSIVDFEVHPEHTVRFVASDYLAFSVSSGPQKCAACIQEGIYEEGISILETSSVRK